MSSRIFARAIEYISGPQLPAVHADLVEGAHDPEMHPDARKWMVDFKNMRQRFDRVNQECDRLNSELGRYKAAYTDVVQDFRLKEDENKAMRSKYEGAQDELARTMQILAERDRALEHAEAKSREMKDLLETRTAELTVFQDFAPSAEQVTDVRVAEMVNELNYEMGQTASSLSDEYAEAKPVPSEQAREALREVKKEVGRGVADILSYAQRGIEQDIAMQIAFQACMSTYAHSIVERWCFGDRYGEKALMRVSKNIEQSEPNHISRKWCSLMRQHARWTVWDQASAEKNYVSTILQRLGQILVATGHSPDSDSALTAVEVKVGAHVAEVVRLAFALNEVLGQKLGAYEMESTRVPHGKRYSAHMQDGYSTAPVSGADGVSQRVPRVLCTTDLGLIREMNGAKDILVAPKVALDTLLPPRDT